MYFDQLIQREPVFSNCTCYTFQLAVQGREFCRCAIWIFLKYFLYFFNFLSSDYDYKVEFSVLYYCDRVVIYLLKVFGISHLSHLKSWTMAPPTVLRASFCREKKQVEVYVLINDLSCIKWDIKICTNLHDMKV